MLEFEEIAALCEDKELFGRVVSKATYTDDEAARISAAYLQIFKKQVVRTCGNCLGDALAALVSMYRKYPERMKEQNDCKYQLRAGLLIRLNFGDNVYYSNANLTDKVAEEYILANQSRLSDFAKYPESILKKIETAKPKAESDKPKASKSGKGGKKNAAKPKTEAKQPEAEPVEEPADGEPTAPKTEPAPTEDHKA